METEDLGIVLGAGLVAWAVYMIARPSSASAAIPPASSSAPPAPSTPPPVAPPGPQPDDSQDPAGGSWGGDPLGHSDPSAPILTPQGYATPPHVILSSPAPSGATMPGTMTASAAGESLIKSHEKYRSTRYHDGTGWAVGWGHHLAAGENLTFITPATGEALFNSDLLEAESAVNHLVKVPLTQNEFDALTSFVFNIGFGRFQNSTLLKDLNAGDYASAAAQFPLWIHDGQGQALSELIARRREEQTLFREGMA